KEYWAWRPINTERPAEMNDKNRAVRARQSGNLQGSVGRAQGDPRSCDAKDYRRHHSESAGNEWRLQCPSGCSEQRSSLDLREELPGSSMIPARKFVFPPVALLFR